jgi:ferredoxin
VPSSSDGASPPRARLTVAVDRDACTSSGMCEALCPDVFELDAEGVLHVAAVIDPGLLREVETAVQSCPTQALTLSAVPTVDGLETS